MNSLALSLLVFGLAVASNAQEPKRDIAYGDQERQVLDIYTPKNAKKAPVLFWIHGGGWQAGDKAGVQQKPEFFTSQGFVFVSTNYRLLPKVEMDVIFKDVAKSLGWVYQHIAEYGGDPQRIIVGGHSAGAQLAALICIDERYAKAEGVPFSALKGCIPVDGDTYDVPAIIEVAETRWRTHGLPPATFGHREKFGNDPAKHKDYSAVTHVAKGKGIPPFLIFHVAEHPDVSAQARRLQSSLKTAEVEATLYSGKETSHGKINADIGKEDDAGTKAIVEFVAKVVPK